MTEWLLLHTYTDKTKDLLLYNDMNKNTCIVIWCFSISFYNESELCKVRSLSVTIITPS